MRVLRNNKDSVMAVLEAFVYDPLLNWRLTADGKWLDPRVFVACYGKSFSVFILCYSEFFRVQ